MDLLLLLPPASHLTAPSLIIQHDPNTHALKHTLMLYTLCVRVCKYTALAWERGA
jgi:hypothetical protein